MRCCSKDSSYVHTVCQILERYWRIHACRCTWFHFFRWNLFYNQHWLHIHRCQWCKYLCRKRLKCLLEANRQTFANQMINFANICEPNFAYTFRFSSTIQSDAKSVMVFATLVNWNSKKLCDQMIYNGNSIFWAIGDGHFCFLQRTATVPRRSWSYQK